MEHPMTKMEEILEIQSLRRVISAYLNYSTAAEEDVQRWERSYAKLSPSHKELLHHLPKKYSTVRRCISVNSSFILLMLQAFDPPFDMSQDDNIYRDNCNGHTHIATIPKVISDERARNTFVATEGRCEYDTALPEKDSIQLCSANKGVDSLRQVQETESSDKMGVENPRRHGHEYRVENWSSTEVKNFQEFSANTLPEYNNPNHDHFVQPSLDVDAGFNIQIPGAGLDLHHPAFHLHVPAEDVDKVRCIIRNIVRDWAEEGAIERDQCYKPILEELQHCFPQLSDGRPPRCLVPGAGLARLACEISRLGFVSQGNEFSYYMLICSSFILNHTQAPLECVIHPWIHSNCNTISDSDQLHAVYFPDLHPGSAGITEGFSMCAGDFVEVYSHPSQAGAWDAVVTCFFIDTAHSIVEYIEIISKILKPGGVWLNLGPLLYHFADARCYSPDEEMSLELSLEDVKKIAFHYGFVLEKERTIETTYTANHRSMMQNRYFASFWTMRKDGVGPKSTTSCVPETLALQSMNSVQPQQKD